MLVKFKVGNFASFEDVQEISMIAGSLGSERYRTFDEKATQPILRSSFIYGKNSSGKSSLILAMIYSRAKIIGLDMRNSTIKSDFKYRYNTDYSHKGPLKSEEESYFEYYIRTKCGYYSYGFEYNTGKGLVVSEWLVKINDDSTESIIFERNGYEFNIAEGDQKLRMISINTEPHELFLSKTFNYSTVFDSPHIGEISSVYLWFKDCFVIRTHNSLQKGLIVKNDVISDISNKISGYDTGISKFEVKKLRMDIKDIRKKIEDEDIKIETLRNGESFVVPFDGRLIKINGSDAEIPFEEIMFEHNQSEFSMMYSYESDGTKRLLLFMFLFRDDVRLNSDTSTYGDYRTIVVDEIDRSMHTLMTKKIISDYIVDDSMQRCQLIASTHECDVLPELRPDEIWFIDKTEDFMSILYSMEEYESVSSDGRDDMYLEGRFNAIPRTRPISRGKI